MDKRDIIQNLNQSKLKKEKLINVNIIITKELNIF